HRILQLNNYLVILTIGSVVQIYSGNSILNGDILADAGNVAIKCSGQITQGGTAIAHANIVHSAGSLIHGIGSAVGSSKDSPITHIQGHVRHGEGNSVTSDGTLNLLAIAL